ncbi:MAG: discoidin domain-containing protein, partial [Ruminococcaceae bacterium]|nr:discoidin domain-containing protein [Oscillospiraceae bacterium]
MKKTLSIILSALMLVGTATMVSAWEQNKDYVVIEDIDPDNYVAYGDSYPASTDWDWPACTSGTLLKGKVIAGCDDQRNHCWRNNETGNASAAFDGDTATLFDPYEASENSWAGVILDQAYELTEVRVMVRGKYLERMNGAAIQGSNDGKNWVTVIYFGQNADAEDFHIITPAPITDSAYVNAGYTDYSTYWVGSGSYQMYRYVNLAKNHGEALELELYGNPAPATTVTKELVAATTYTAANFYNGVVEATEIASSSDNGTIVGTVIGAGGCYKNNNPYENAWDGKADTYYDPASASLNCWTGIKVDSPVVVKEVKILPRADRPDRTNGAYVQGSNDGKLWTTLASYSVSDCLSAQDWIVKPAAVEKAFTMFRYVNSVSHGDVAEVALIGEVKAPTAAAPETAAPETAAPETAAPETAAPETAAPETAAPETAAPETAAPETAAP